MISCIEWIPKGVADPTPKRYEMSAKELEMLQHQAEFEAKLKEGGEDVDEMEDAGAETGSGKNKSNKSENDLPADLRMDEYSSDEDEAKVGNLLIGKSSEIFGTEIDENGMPVTNVEEEKDMMGTKEDASNNDDDDSDDDFDEDDLGPIEDSREYMPVDVEGLEGMGLASSSGPMYFGEDGEDDDSDVEDTNLSPDDAIIVVAKTEEDFASLQVHVYEQKTGNLFVHHDIPLPAFPLCLAHGDINNDGQAGNYCAVGTFNPGIEVWNMDVLDALEPICILGGEDTTAADDLMKLNMSRASTGKKLKKKKNRIDDPSLKPESHTDAIMALSWNKVHRQVIASGSADKTVKLWDITQAGSKDGAPAATFTHHRDKVNSLAWHPSEGTLLATGSFDRTVSLIDVRAADGPGNIKTSKLPGDCEAIAWDPFNEQYLTVASEDGTVTCWDVRNFDQPCWSFVAHEFGGISDLSYNQHIPGFFTTCAVDKTVALWDAKDITGTSNRKPYQCGSKEMNVGKLFSVSFYPSTPWLLGCGGSGNSLALWDLSSEDAIQKRFADRVHVSDTTAEQNSIDDDGAKEKDFEAMMSSNRVALEKMKEVAATNRGKNKKKKKKVHKTRR